MVINNYYVINATQQCVQIEKYLFSFAAVCFVYSYCIHNIYLLFLRHA